MFGYQALVAGLLARARAELAETAGIAPRIACTRSSPAGCPPRRGRADVDGVDLIDPDLTLKGLAILARRGRGRRPVPRAGPDAAVEAPDADGRSPFDLGTCRTLGRGAGA